MGNFVQNGQATAAEAEGFPSPDLNALQSIQEQFARHFQLVVSTMLHADLSASVNGIRQSTYGAFLREIPAASYLCPIALPPETGSVVLYLSLELALPMLELMMGATITSPTDLQRPLTTVDEELLETIAHAILRPLSKSWKSVADIEFSLLPRQSRKSNLPLPDETVIVVSFDIAIGKDAHGQLSLILPSFLLRKAQASFGVPLPAPEKAPESEQSDLILSLLQSAILEFEARLNGPKVGLRNLLNLKEGQILLLDSPLDQAVDGMLNDTRFYRGEIVSDGKQRFLLIDGFL